MPSCRGKHIALDVAHALFFLHSRPSVPPHPTIIASPNVYLTKDHTAKLSIVGMAGALAEHMSVSSAVDSSNGLSQWPWAAPGRISLREL